MQDWKTQRKHPGPTAETACCGAAGWDRRQPLSGGWSDTVPGEVSDVDQDRRRRRMQVDEPPRKSTFCWRVPLAIMLALTLWEGRLLDRGQAWRYQATAQGGGDGGDDGNHGGNPPFYKILRPEDGTVFPVNTRSFSIIGVKPFGRATMIEVEDPMGHIQWITVPAIRPYFSPTFDRNGHPLPPGEYEITLFDPLEPAFAEDQVGVEIQEEAGDPGPFPSLDFPRPGETFAPNVPFIVFGGICGREDPVFLEIYEVSTDRRVFHTDFRGNLENVWAFVVDWAYGPGNFKAVVYAMNPELGAHPTDVHHFRVKTMIEGEIWPVLWRHEIHPDLYRLGLY